jgi:hypothetical protein
MLHDYITLVQKDKRYFGAMESIEKKNPCLGAGFYLGFLV